MPSALLASRQPMRGAGPTSGPQLWDKHDWVCLEKLDDTGLSHHQSLLQQNPGSYHDGARLIRSIAQLFIVQHEDKQPADLQ